MGGHPLPLRSFCWSPRTGFALRSGFFSFLSPCGMVAWSAWRRGLREKHLLYRYSRKTFSQRRWGGWQYPRPHTRAFRVTELDTTRQTAYEKNQTDRSRDLPRARHERVAWGARLQQSVRLHPSIVMTHAISLVSPVCTLFAYCVVHCPACRPKCFVNKPLLSFTHS